MEFNPSLTGSQIYEQFLYLEGFLNFYKPKLVILGIDFNSFGTRLNPGTSAIRLKGNSRLEDYLTHLFSFDVLRASADTIRASLAGSRNYIDFTSGQLAVPEAERERANRYGWFDKPALPDIDGGLTVLKKLVALSQERNFRLVIFNNPIYYRTNEFVDSEYGGQYEKWLASVAGIHEFYDFNGFNRITTSDDWFPDHSHPAGKVGELIFSKLIGQGDSTAPIEFGSLVTRGNVDSHIANLRRQRDEWQRQRKAK